MKKHFMIKSVIAVLAFAAIAQAQQNTAGKPTALPSSQVRPETQKDEAIFDDDGGRVFIVGRNAKSLENLSNHGGEAIVAPEPHNIFLGKGWIDPKARAGEAALAGLLATLDAGNEQALLERYGVHNLFSSSFSYESSIGFANNSVSDLQIRAALAKMFADGELPTPSANALYVVYLAPGVRSTLGTMFGGKHYNAYHNYFNAEAGEVRYVVVPFDANKERLQQTARRALVEAIINPSGNGWY